MSTWVIDTNILEHLLFTAPAVVDPHGNETPAGKNHDGHITLLLKTLIELKTTLVWDDKELIREEYKERLEHRIKSSPETTSSQLLRWAIEYSPKIKIKVNSADGLMGCIDQTAIYAQWRDKRIVYVAAAACCPLATNNPHHINNVAQGLKKCAKKHAAKGLEIYNSREALAVVTASEHPAAAPAE